ncbi:MAG: T9SS type A sorting domain-containing protein, partial [Flavobacteriales bacterium]|nr:T9SS type A sorting domain-containing protein [Flavobacteriales bacterium]
ISSAATNVLASGNITHDVSSIDITGTVASWTVQWIAPAPGAGDVTFYSSFLAADGNGGTSGSGDQVFKGSTLVTEGVATSINEPLQSSVKIYPNPTSDFLNVSHIEKISQVRIFDISGKIWLVKDGMNQEKVNLSLENLSTGIYHVEITVANGVVYTEKIIKN